MLNKISKNINRGGFTLMEVIIVMVVIGILVALAVPKFGQFKDKAMITAIKNDTEVLRSSLGLSSSVDSEKFFKNSPITEQEKSELKEMLIYKNGKEADIDNFIGGDLFLIDQKYIREKTSSKLIEKGDFYLDREYNIYFAIFSEDIAIKSNLRNSIYEAQSLDENNYDKSEWKKFSKELDKFKKIYKDKSSTKEMVDEAAEQLEILIDSLIPLTEIEGFVVIDFVDINSGKIVKEEKRKLSYGRHEIKVSSFDEYKLHQTDSKEVFIGKENQHEPLKFRVYIENKDYSWVSSDVPGAYSAINEEGVGYYNYVGNSNIVEIPNTINGNNMTNYSYMFKDYQNNNSLKVISKNPNVRVMSYMFNNTNVGKLDLSELNTKNVSNMNYMFFCSKLNEVNLSMLDTGNVVRTDHMFRESVVASLNLESLDLSNAEAMNHMFFNSKIDNLNLSKIKTDNVKDMSYMFRDSNIDDIDISSFNTTNLTDIQQIFSGSTAKTIRGIENLDTSNVEAMNHMFYDSKVQNLDLSNFNTSKVKRMDNMFRQSEVKELDLSSFDTSNVTIMNHMFIDSEAVIINVDGWDTTKVTDMSYMFRNTKAKKLDLSSFNTQNVTNMHHMFLSSSATELNLSNFNTSKVINMNNMFRNSKAEVLDLSSFNIEKVTDMENIFVGSRATTGYARTQEDANKFNSFGNNPTGLVFKLKE